MSKKLPRAQKRGDKTKKCAAAGHKIFFSYPLPFVDIIPPFPLPF